MADLMYAPPQSNLEPKPDVERVEFYIVSLRKFVILYLATLGWYGLYWFYRHWSENRRFSGSSVLPVIRAMFAFIFAFPLFRKVDQSLRRQELGAMRSWLLSAGVLLVLSFASVLMVLAGGNAQVEGRVSWFGLTLALLIAQILNLSIVQRKMNMAALDPDGASNSTFSGANWAWIALGSLVWTANLANILLYEI
jgi:hypothetical protein